MGPVDLAAVPERHREKAASALSAAFGEAPVAVHPVAGGASGALTYRVDAAAGAHLLRIETITGPLRNPHQYTCMQLAADAGIAPPVRYVDADAGVVVMSFLDQRPLTEHPGGPSGIAAEVGALLARVHELPGFPSRGDYLDNLGRMLRYLATSGRVAAGLLDRHAEGFERIRVAYPWQPDEFVSAHNDPNQFNVLSDGDRLWLIDWETAYPNDPLIDVATVAGYLTPTPELRDVLLTAWLGRAPDDLVRAKATIAGALTHLYAGCILLTVVLDPAIPTHVDLTPMSIESFGAAIERGELVPGQPTTTHAYAKIVLQSFLDELETPTLADALRTAAG